MSHVAVPGGSLYYEVRGSGPLLLAIGQPMTSAPFASLADELAADHTVVTYDPHGLGASSVTDASADVTPEVEADDLAVLVDVIGAEKADLFATSGGAVAALAFAARHPDRVGTLIAHEPPVADLLPDAPHIRVVIDGIEETYRSQGSVAAWGEFIALVVHDGPVTADGVQPVPWPPGGTDADAPPVSSEKQRADDELFFLRMLKPFTRYDPPVDVLRAGTPRVVVAFGEVSGNEIAKRSAEVLAERLGTAPEVFPGDHGGFMADAAGFAAKIRQIL